MNIRLDRLLADSGCGTRSEVKLLVRSGSVFVNDVPEKNPGRKINMDTDIVVCKGERIYYNEFEYYMLNKPAGVITATKDGREKTVLDLIKTSGRRDLSPVGRLDKDTEGLLLITNDGKLAHELLAPGKHVSKVYEAFISGELPDEAEISFREGIDIGDDKPTLPAKLEILGQDASSGQTHVRVTITEGRYHQIKRMFGALECKVEYLKRISMGNLELDDSLAPGEYKVLTGEEIQLLKS